MCREIRITCSFVSAKVAELQVATKVPVKTGLPRHTARKLKNLRCMEGRPARGNMSNAVISVLALTRKRLGRQIVNNKLDGFVHGTRAPRTVGTFHPRVFDNEWAHPGRRLKLDVVLDVRQPKKPNAIIVGRESSRPLVNAQLR